MMEPSLQPEVETNPPQLPHDLWRNEVHDRVAGYRKRSGRRIEGAFSMRFAFPPAVPLASPAIGLEDENDGPRVALRDKLHEEDETASANVERGGVIATAADAIFPSPEPPHPVFPVESPERVPWAPADPKAASFQWDNVAEPWMPGAGLPDHPSSGAWDLDAPAIGSMKRGPDPVPAPPASRPGRGKRKVIAFPRPPSPPEASHRLADPITPEQPRILDVPEELQAYSTTPLLDGLQLPSDPQIAAAPPPDHIELPFQAANISRRLYAGLLDCGLVLMAAAGFAVAAYRALPKLSPSKPVLLAAGAMLLLLWAVYQYLFTLYSDATPGMRALHLHLSTFKGRRLSWRHRRSRVFGLYFSTASLMMGLLWALVDVDALCWHDRISRTYLAKQE
jgi:uncharacterized RDD family membrane protein YckC